MATVLYDDGEEVWARRVVVATGITNYSYIPPELSGFSSALLSHSSQVTDENYLAGGAAGKEILIVGGGASAVDLAAMLGQAGASVTIIARRNKIAYCGAPAPRSWIDDLRAPISGLGTGWRSVMCVKAPLVFHHMPAPFRTMVVRKHLGPAPGWVPREYVEQHVAMKLGQPSWASARSPVGPNSWCGSSNGVHAIAGDSSSRRPDTDRISAGLTSSDAASAADCAVWMTRQSWIDSSSHRSPGFTSPASPRRTALAPCSASPMAQPTLPDASAIIFIAL